MGDALQNILNYKRLHKLKDTELAKLLQVDRSLPGKWESGESYPSRNKFPDFAKALGVTKEELINGNLFTDLTRVEEPSSTVYRMIPFYDAVAIAGFDTIGDQSPVSRPKNMIYPGTFFRNAEGALQITGHSMFPKYPSGCIVAYRQATLTLILWGEDYVIELKEDRRLILKRIEKSEVKGCIKAVSYNVNKDQKYVYDPIDLPLEQVGRIFMVLGKIELEAMQS